MRHNANLIRNAVTQYDCATYEQIANITGLSIPMVAATLHWLRRPWNAKNLGWTIPHTRRGAPKNYAVRRYMVVGLQGQTLDADDQGLLWSGSRSTLKLVASQCEAMGHALRQSAVAVPEPRVKRVFNHMAGQLENQAAEARYTIEAEIDANAP